MMKGGTTERIRGAGIVGTSVGPERRLQGASLVVLFGWSLFVVAGCGFAKYAEHWDLVTPHHDRGVPSAAFVAVQAAAAAGVVIFSIAALLALPAFVQHIRVQGWDSVRRPLIATLVTSGIAVVATGGVIVWSHHVGASPLNNGLWPFRVVGLTWALLVVAAIAVGTGAIASVMTRIEPSPRTSRSLGVLAVGMATTVVVVFLGVLTWWIALALHAPWFFGSGKIGNPGPVAPPAMVVIGGLMVIGLILGTCGGARVMRALRAMSRTEFG